MAFWCGEAGRSQRLLVGLCAVAISLSMERVAWALTLLLCESCCDTGWWCVVSGEEGQRSLSLLHQTKVKNGAA